ncbi:hypothetical protein H4R18_002661 [Coemansia javaensis]|uniref:alpha-1,2-Mannosidase n=1 Tax=Coemansia javaensis TaxID=2761396 RepID=A0A9W8HCF8_9FUNG|nr:hypothetical protein H4R18_002661 [Coemansia javaensis]
MRTAPLLPLAFAALAQPWLGAEALGMTTERRLELRSQVKDAFYHAYSGYMEHAFPFDELKPISGNFGLNDVLGDYLLTLVDTLDTLAVLGDRDAFARAVDNTLTYLGDFNIDSHVQVFEVTIRMLGGLLSAHIIATDEDDALGMRLDTNGTYGGGLLRLARDLGYRLLPAFEASPNGVPYPRTNLKHGFPVGETPTTCAAGAGSLLLEFGALSRLTNETIFEDVARLALSDMWAARSKRNLFGNTYNLETQTWTLPVAGISAGVDSIYEYLFKSYVYFDDERYLRAFEATYSALLRYSRDTTGGYAFYNVHMETTDVSSFWVDALSAFFPGLMVLAGDVDGAESAYLLYYHLWDRFRAMPERFNLHLREPDIAYYVLRPEFIESTYYLYRATRDPFYLAVGEMVLRDMNELMRTRCGFTALKDVRTHALDERMDSFVLSETFKYLYLLFDDENPLHRVHSNHVFTTEGHLLLPLSAARSGSKQYPRGSSFSRRRLVHAEHPPRDIKPSMLKIDNIRKKIRAARLDDGFAFPVFPDSGAAHDSAQRGDRWLRRCAVPRALGLAAHYRAAASNGTGEGPLAVSLAHGLQTPARKSPLDQLHTRQLVARALQSRAGRSPVQRSYLLALHASMSTETVPLRNDFDNIGALVQPKLSAGRNGTSSSGGGSSEADTASAGRQLARSVAQEFGGMCSVPHHLFLTQRHQMWRDQILSDARAAAVSGAHIIDDIPDDADTWMQPGTRQYCFTDYLLADASGGQIALVDAPASPAGRAGVPLLRDLRGLAPEAAGRITAAAFYEQQREQLGCGERLMMRNAAAESAKPRYRGYADFADPGGQHQQHQHRRQRLVPTNGAGQRLAAAAAAVAAAVAAVAASAARLRLRAGSGGARLSSGSVRLGAARRPLRQREHAGRLAYFAEMSLYRGDEARAGPQWTALAMPHLHGPSSAYGCEEYTPRERRLFRGRVMAAPPSPRDPLLVGPVAGPPHQISMPVVMVGSAVIDGLEADLAAGLHVEIELL